MSDDLKASGINPPEETEVEKAVHDIWERFEETKKVSIEKAKSLEEDAAKALKMRRQSLETFSDSKKRKECDGDELCTQKRSRNTGSETFRLLKEKADSDKSLKEMEINFRR